jgi:hypothetical protein
METVHDRNTDGSSSPDLLAVTIIDARRATGGAAARPARVGLLRTLLPLVIAAFLLAGAASATAATTGAPVNTALPVISGTMRDGSFVRATPGKWQGLAIIHYAYQWLRCDASGNGCTELAGATIYIHKLEHEDVGHTMRVIVTATNSEGTATATSQHTATIAVLAPAKAKVPVITGTAEDGQVLTTSNGVWKGTPPLTFSYQWRSCVKLVCTTIPGATGQTYRATTAELGQQLRVSVTAANSAGTATSSSYATAKILPGPPVNTASPTISGLPIDGQTLTASPGTWAGTPPFSFAYRWRSCSILTGECADIAGATGSTYTAGPLDVASELEVVVTATGAHGTAAATSAPTGLISALLPGNTSLPAIVGSLLDGQLLSAATGAWTGTGPLSYSYQWQQCNSSGEACKDINSATSATLGLVSSLVGSTVRVVVTATNSGGSTHAASTATSLIGALLPGNTSLPSIAGSLIDGQTITAATGGWSGTSPISYGYQ